MNTDRVEKTVVLKGTRTRVWRAISDAREFGTWFGVEIDGPFVEGVEAIGRIVPTQVDADVARMQESHRGAPWRVWIERMEPERLFAFRWHPFAIDPARDYTAEPTTLVTFELADAEDGVHLTITESGFDQLPPNRRTAAFVANDGGWAHQSRLIAKYVARTE